MMGWMVEVLLRNREQIKSNASSLQHNQTLYEFPVSQDVLSIDELEETYGDDSELFSPPDSTTLDRYDQYNDLLMVEKKIKEMYSDGLLSDMDMDVIRCIGDGKLMLEAEKLLGKERHAISSHFSSICRRIAYFLGGYFTDEGLIDNISKNNNLTDEQVELLRDYISGNRKHQIIRKPKN